MNNSMETISLMLKGGCFLSTSVPALAFSPLSPRTKGDPKGKRAACFQTHWNWHVQAARRLLSPEMGGMQLQQKHCDPSGGNWHNHGQTAWFVEVGGKIVIQVKNMIMEKLGVILLIL